MTYDEARPELIWPGKYDERGTRRPVQLPSEAPALRLREAYGADAGQRNLLIWGDNKLALAALLERLRGQVDLIYIDPPFDVGADFTMQVQVGQEERSFSFESVAYRDVWGTGVDSYLHMMFERLTLLRELLSERGSIYLHCDWRVSAYLRCLMDEIFGAEQFRNEIVWSYRTGGASRRSWSQKHDTILFYSKTAGYSFNQQREKSYTKSKSRRPGVINYGAGTAEFFEDAQGVYTWVNARAVWELPYINSQAAERLAFPTQKPEALLERIIAASSNPGDLVLDAFCGSGTTLAAAQRLGRRWIGVDLGRRAIQTATKRLSALGCSFDLCDVEEAERRWWALRLEDAGRSFRDAVLERYGATPIDHPKVHGERDGALVYVAGLDERITRARLRDLARAAGDGELHCLAWDAERGAAAAARSLAAELGVAIRLIQIPRELLEQNRGAVTFFALGAADARVVEAAGALEVELVEFLPPLPATPLRGVEALREHALRAPFDLIDWWAVDVSWREGQPFAPQWQAFRTRADRALPLRSAAVPAVPGGRICVKVVDVFGQETFAVVVV